MSVGVMGNAVQDTQTMTQRECPLVAKQALPQLTLTLPPSKERMPDTTPENTKILEGGGSGGGMAG